MDGRGPDADGFEICADPLAGSGFRSEVHLPGKIAAEGPQKLDWPVTRDVRRACFRDLGKTHKQAHIGFHARGGARAANFHDDLATVP